MLARPGASHLRFALVGPNCVFCDIIEERVPAHIVVDEAEVMAFLDARPVFPGHTLVVPRQHVDNMLDCPADLLASLFLTARRLAAAMIGALGAQGSFVGVNNTVSQSVAHLHVHVVPRKFKDGLRGFFWPRQRYANDEEASLVATAIQRAYSNLTK